MQNFVFPTNLQLYQRFNSVRELKEQLADELRSYRGLWYYVRMVSNKKINTYYYVAICTKCSAKLFYRPDNVEGGYILRKSRVHHNHRKEDAIEILKEIQAPFVLKRKERLNVLYDNQIIDENQRYTSSCIYVTYWKMRHLTLLCFSGLDNKQQIRIVGLTVFDMPTENRISYCVKKFLTTRKRPISTFILNNEVLIPFIEPFFEGTIITLPHQQIHNYQLKLMMEKILSTSSQKQWEQNRREFLIKSKELNLPFSVQQMIKFLESYERISLLALPCAFVGLGISISHQNSIKHEFEQCMMAYGRDKQRLLLFFKKKIQFRQEDQKIDQMIRKIYEAQEHNSIVSSLYDRISNSALKYIIEELSRSFNYSIKVCKDQTYIIKRDFQKQQYVVCKKIQKYFCSCQIAIKTSLPCSHLLKVFCYQKINIRSQIHDFWMKKQL